MANSPPGKNLLPSLRESWQNEKFPLLFAKFTPAYGCGLAPGRNPQFNPAAVGGSSRLNFSFERHQYISVQYKEYHPVSPQLVSYVLYVYGVQPCTGEDEDEGSLIVTMYSNLRTTELWQFQAGLSDEHNVGMRELLLHYWNFESMGTRQDAVVIPINKIAAVYPVLPAMLGNFESIVHTVDMPDPSRTPYYCRFAVRCGLAPSTAACVMPVASHLLSHVKRWPEPRYSVHMRPSVIDLSPAFLGLAEGFSQAGCSINAAFDFDPAVNYTWKARYPDANLYDGPLRSIVSDIVAKALSPPGIPRDNPLILLLTIPDRDINTWDPAREFHILQVLPALIAVLNKPDMLVIALPPWALVEQAFSKFFPIVYALLQERYAVHLKRITMSRFGPVSGEILFLVASCVPAPIPWDVVLGSVQDQAEAYILEQASVNLRIGDLNFLNARAFTHSSGSTESLVCSHPISTHEIYNHPAGLAGSPSVTVDLNKKVPLDMLKRGVKHFQRSDALTVRELARVQGFPDDFVFLGGRAQQYADVLGGVQPAIARDVAARAVMVFREFIAPVRTQVSPAAMVAPSPRVSSTPRVVPMPAPTTATLPAHVPRHMPQSGSFSAPPSAAPGSATFTASGSGFGSGSNMPAATPGSAVSETTIPGSMASGSTVVDSAVPGATAPALGVNVFQCGSGDASNMPMSAPANTTSFPGPGSGPGAMAGPIVSAPSNPMQYRSTGSAPMQASRSVSHPVGRSSGHHPSGSDTVMSDAPGLGSSFPVPGMFSGSDVSMFSPAPRTVSGPIVPVPVPAPVSAPVSRVPSGTMPVSAPADRVSFSSGGGASTSSNRAGPTMDNPNMDSNMHGSMNAPLMSAPASQSKFPFLNLERTNALMAGADDSSSPEPVSVPSRPVSSRLSSAFRPSAIPSRPRGFDSLPVFTSPGEGFAPIADPLASMSAHVQEPSLPPSAGTDLDADFDMEEFLDEFLDTNYDNNEGEQGGEQGEQGS